MEAAARLMFGDVESKRLMSALWRARDREEGAGGASTPTLGSRGSPRPSLDGMETDSAGATRRGPGVGQLPALRRLPEASCNSWDWVDPAPESPSEMRSDARAEDGSSPGDAETQSKVFRVASMKMLRSVDEDGDERGLIEDTPSPDNTESRGGSATDAAGARDDRNKAQRTNETNDSPGSAFKRRRVSHDDLTKHHDAMKKDATDQEDVSLVASNAAAVDAANVEDSDVMKALRRRWESISGGGGAGGGGSGVIQQQRANPPVAGAAAPVGPASVKASRPKRATPNLKQRLTEVVIPVKCVATGAWSFNTRVTGLNLANASIGPEGAKFIAKALHGRRNGDGSWVFNTTLRTLNLEFNSIGTEGVIAIASALCPRWVPSDPNVAEYVYGGGDGKSEPPLEDVSLDHVQRVGGGKWVCNTTMKVLNFNFCDIDAVGAGALSRLLTPRVDEMGDFVYCSGVANISLFHNHIGPDGARALGDAIAPRRQQRTGELVFNPKFESLNVGRNQLGDLGLAHLARAFKPAVALNGCWCFNPTFRHLHANMNSCLSQAGPLAIGESLSPRANPDGSWAFSSSLTTLHLANVFLGEEGGKAVASVVAPRRTTIRGAPTYVFPSTLRVLNLSRTGLGDVGAGHIGVALQPVWCVAGGNAREFAADGDPGAGAAWRPIEGGDAAGAGAGGGVGFGRWVFNAKMREVHLGGNSIGVAGAQAIARAIAPRRNNLSDKVNATEESMWAFNTALRVLDLRDNAMGREGAEAIAAAIEPVAVDVDAADNSSPESLSGASSLGTFPVMPGSNAAPLGSSSPSDSRLPGSVSNLLDRRANASERRARRRWIPGGGALAVLNLEFNNIGPEGICAIATALEPRWCLWACAEHTTASRASSPALSDSDGGGHVLGMSTGSSPGSTPGSLTPALTPRGASFTSASRPASGRLFASSRPVSGRARRHSAVDATADPRDGSLAALACVGAGGEGCECAACANRVWDAPPRREKLPFSLPGPGDGHWVVNRSLKALGVAGNGMGDAGATALAAAVEPRIGVDGGWVTSALHAIDASENVIGVDGLHALADALEPKCTRCARPRSRPGSARSGSSSGSDGTRCCAAHSLPHSKDTSSHGGSVLRSVLTTNAVAAAARADAAAATTKLFNAVGLSDGEDANSEGGGAEGAAADFVGGFPSPAQTTTAAVECSYGIRASIRRLDLMSNNPDPELKERFKSLTASGGGEINV